MFNKIDSLLYIEDDDEIRENIAVYFKHRVTHLYTAKDGLEGLAIFQELTPQVIVTDIAMPKLNGIELLKKVRKLSSTTQLIITTSFENKEYLLEAVNLQLTNYLLKPLTIQKLDNALKICESNISVCKQEKIYFSQVIYFDMLKKELFNAHKSIPLTVKERKLLELFIQTHPAPISYELAFSRLYDGFENKDALKTLVKNVEKKD
jgi:YesN/AraC family two-component response regulator